MCTSTLVNGISNLIFLTVILLSPRVFLNHHFLIFYFTKDNLEKKYYLFLVPKTNVLYGVIVFDTVRNRPEQVRQLTEQVRHPASFLVD